MLKSQSSPFCSWYDNPGLQVDSQLIKWKVLWAGVRTSRFWSWICPNLPLTLGFPPPPRGSDQDSLKMPSSSGNLGVNLDANACSLFWPGFSSLSLPHQFQCEVKEIPQHCFVSRGGTLPPANFSISVSFLQKLAVSTFQLIANWHTPDSKYLCLSRESLIQLSTWSHQPALWFQHLRISKRGNMQIPKSPRENSSGEAVIGGRERSSNERYYRSLEMKEIGVGEGRKWRIWRLETLTPHGTGGCFSREGLSRSAELQMRHGSSCWEADLVLEAAEMGVLLERLSQVSVPNKFSTPTCWQNPTIRITLQCVL